jgi:hypothetical protein
MSIIELTFADLFADPPEALLPFFRVAQKTFTLRASVFRKAPELLNVVII